MTNPVYNQNGFRFYEDHSSDPWSNDLALENVDISIDVDTIFIFRVEVEVTNTKAVNNATFTLQADVDGAGYNQVTTTADATTPIKIVAAQAYADGDGDANNRLSSSALTFSGGVLHESVNSFGGVYPSPAGMDYAGQDHWEIAVALQVDSTYDTSGGKDYDLRIYDGGGTQLDGYTRTPRVTSNEYTPRRVFITRA